MESAEKAFTTRSRGLLTARSRERGSSGPRPVKNAAFFFAPVPYQRSATSPNALSPRGHGKFRATDFDAGSQHPASGPPRTHSNRKGLAVQALARRLRPCPLTTGSRWLFLPSPLGRVLGRFLPRRDPEMALGCPGGGQAVLCVPEPETGPSGVTTAKKPRHQPFVRSDAVLTSSVRISPKGYNGSPKDRLHKPNFSECRSDLLAPGSTKIEQKNAGRHRSPWRPLGAEGMEKTFCDAARRRRPSPSSGLTNNAPRLCGAARPPSTKNGPGSCSERQRDVSMEHKEGAQKVVVPGVSMPRGRAASRRATD